MMSGIACRLLPLYRDLSVALAMDAFPRLTLLVLGAVPLLVSLLTTYGTLVVVVPTIPRSAFTPETLTSSRETLSSAALLWGLVCAAAIDVASLRFDVCRRSASLVSITAWSRCCLAIMLNNASGSLVSRSKRICFSTLRRNSSGSIPAAIASTSTLPCFSV